MGCICDKEVLYFGEGSRDTSLLLYLFLTVYRHDLIGLKNQRFCLVKNDRKGKNGLMLKSADGVCSIFLRIDRSINKISKSFTKSMYLFITDIFYVHSFAIKLLKSF
jgi:hypothetical protein